MKATTIQAFEDLVVHRYELKRRGKNQGKRINVYDTKLRKCLGLNCGVNFKSKSAGNRICSHCHERSNLSRSALRATYDRV